MATAGATTGGWRMAICSLPNALRDRCVGTHAPVCGAAMTGGARYALVQPCAMAEVGARLSSEPALADAARDALRVGIHWDTDTAVTRRNSSTNPPHRVCQVFCSALPVAYAKSTGSKDWAPVRYSSRVTARPSTCLLVGTIILVARARAPCTRCLVLSSHLPSTGACGYNRPCAHQYVGKYQSCMVENGRLIPHASYLLLLSPQFACLVLQAAYEATLLAASLLSRQRTHYSRPCAHQMCR